MSRRTSRKWRSIINAPFKTLKTFPSIIHRARGFPLRRFSAENAANRGDRDRENSQYFGNCYRHGAENGRGGGGGGGITGLANSARAALINELLVSLGH